MQPLTSSLYHYEDVSFFEDLSEGDQNDGRIVHFDVKVCVKIHTSMDRNLTVASKCVLQNRMFDPNSENYMLFSKPRSERFWTLSAFREQIQNNTNRKNVFIFRCMNSIFCEKIRGFLFLIIHFFITFSFASLQNVFN